MRVYVRSDPLERFIRLISVDGEGCWRWLGNKTTLGYGYFTDLGGKHVRAHGWAYRHFIGPVAPQLQLDHLCRVRDCVNPTHLEPVTARENTLRGDTIPARNAAKTHCIRGHALTEDNLIREGAYGRHCRECQRAASRRHYLRRKHGAAA